MSSFHLGRPFYCYYESVTRGQPVSSFRRHYARVLGVDYNEPELPFNKSTANLFDNVTECGKPAVDGSTAVMKGHDAPEKAWPWQVLMFLQEPNNATSICGGSLISESWVLTAAHCVIGVKLLIFLGVRDLSKLREDVQRNNSGVLLRRAEKIIAHKGYTSHKADDIALIKLDKAVIYSEYVQPICLPKPGQTFEDGEDGHCYVTGWGRVDSTHGQILILQQAKMNIMPQNLCIFTSAILGARLDFRNLCLDLNDDASGLCYGDSGGPLSCKVDGRFVLAGVTQAVAKKYNCSNTIFPSIDGRVTEYLEWIAINLRENEQ